MAMLPTSQATWDLKAATSKRLRLPTRLFTDIFVAQIPHLN